MSLRYRRLVHLAPGVRVDLSKSGPGPIPVTAGGAPVGAGPWGALAVDPGGVVQIVDDEGVPLPPGALKRARAEHSTAIRAWLAERCAAWNELGERILGVHLETPAPSAPLLIEPHPFEEPPPAPFVPREPDLLERSWPPHRKRLEAENAAGQRAYEEALWEWRRRRSAHEAAEERRRKQIDIGRYGDRVVMETFLHDYLAGLDWPTEVAAAFEISLDARSVFLDLELPGTEVVPGREAVLAARGLRIRYLERSEAQVRRAFAWFVHAVTFRLLGEVFRALPGVERVVVSGATAGDFLLSAEVERTVWRRFDFERLDALDLITAFDRFHLRRKLTKHGVFTPIVPFGSSGVGGLFEQRPTPAGGRSR